MAEPIHILVTAIGGGGHGEQILKALREVNSGRYVLHGADINANSPQRVMVDRFFVTPPASSPKFIEKVLEYSSKNAIRAVFHGCEPELRAYSDARDAFAKAGILLPINPKAVIETCLDKQRTAAALRELGFSPPAYAVITAPGDVENVDWYPVVAKPRVGGGGSSNCFIAQDDEELSHLLAYLRVDCSRPLMVQEYVGTPENEFTVGILHDLDGGFVNSIALRRELKSSLSIRSSVQNRSNRADLGTKLIISSGISQGEIGRFPEVTEPCERIAAALGVAGPINIQCRLVNGTVKVFEINPRFSGTTSIRAKMGFNEPDILLRRHLLGEDIETRFRYREGLVLRSLIEAVL